MEIGLKERLIGAVVLVILAVIIIPWVLKGGSAPSTTVTKPLTLPQATTAAPPQEAYRMDLNNPAARAQSMATASSTSAPASATTRAVIADAALSAPSSANPAAKPVNTYPAPPSKSIKQPLPASAGRAITTGKWVVQAGSYSSETNARSVERRLAKHGYHAYISLHHKGGHTYYRVRVGPYVDRAAAKRRAPQVARAYGGRAEVVPNS